MKQSKKHLLLPTFLFGLGLLAAAGSAPAQASEVGTQRKFGLGGMLGAPNGLSMKYYLGQKHALDFGAGFGWWGAAIYVHADYLFHIELTKTEHFDLPLYIGVGPKLTVWFSDHHPAYWGGKKKDGHLGIGVRVPIGIAFNLNKVPLDVFLEVVPGVGFFPGVGAYLDGAVGVRYYF